ncbi:YceD family protein [Flavobacterium sp. HNIBRBA15423]|uniref:YceD family protein n=1 Tax=Flavobacterium sp. HNIBRBA15423 TaxID=3458683 RepID=UPI004044AC60
MKNLKAYLIQFSGLKIGKHQFDYQLDNSFFEHFNYDDFNNVDIKVDLILEKKNTMLELNFKHKGVVNVPCDLTNEPFDLPVKSKLKLIVNFGDSFNDENEELLILPHGEFQVDVSQYIYEMVVLSVPFKRIHPGVKDGTLKTDVLDKLDKLSPKEENKEEENIDPRWENLKKLLTDK